VDIDPEGGDGNLTPTLAHQAQYDSVQLKSLVSGNAKVVVIAERVNDVKRVGIVEDEVVVQRPENDLLPYFYRSSIHRCLFGH